MIGGIGTRWAGERDPGRAPVTPDVALPATTAILLPQLPPRRAKWLTGWRFALLGLLITAVSFAVRVYRLDSVGFNSDEAVYAGQGASISGDPVMLPFFPVFRAHPLLLQTTLAGIYELVGVSDAVGRLTVVGFGMATVLAAYMLGSALFGRDVGLLTAALIGLMPYHVIVSRQVLLDAPQTLFNTLALWALVKYSTTRREAWLYVSALMLGLSVLGKETAIILSGAYFVYFALVPQRLRLRAMTISVALFTAVVATYPISLRMAASGRTGGAFITYQLFRRPNHTFSFYFTVVPPALGIGVVIAAALGVWLLRHTWRDTLLWIFVVIPVAFFGLFPVKGYQYLLPIAPPLAVLAARFLVAWPSSERLAGLARWFRRTRWPGMPSLVARPMRDRLTAVAAVAIFATIAVPTWRAIQPSEESTFLAGTGGIPRGRELGAWIRTNTPEGVTIMTIGPSMANIIQWYGNRTARGLSVSPNPLYRNPVYDPLPNPDLSIRRNEVQYIVWDSFSAQRSSHFSASLMRYVERYHGHEVHRETVPGRDADGNRIDVPIMIVYEVRPL